MTASSGPSKRISRTGHARKREVSFTELSSVCRLDSVRDAPTTILTNYRVERYVAYPEGSVFYELHTRYARLAAETRLRFLLFVRVAVLSEIRVAK